MSRDFLEGANDTNVLRHTELLDNLPLVHEVLSTCNNEEGIQAAELIRRIAGDSDPASSDAFRRIASLIKYGLLEVTIPEHVE